MIIVNQPTAIAELQRMAKQQFGDFVKAVVDIRRQVIAIGGELHADEENLLIEHGSHQDDLWGINIFPDKPPGDRIEFDSMINIRPSRGNRSRNVEDPVIKQKIIDVVQKLLV